MNTSEGALKVAIHRLRKQYREIFRQEIADTGSNPAEVEVELRYLGDRADEKIGAANSPFFLADLARKPEVICQRS